VSTAPPAGPRRALRAVTALWPFAAVVLAWQLLVVLGGYSDLIIPTPAAVAADLVGDPGFYLHETIVTLRVAVAGLAVGLAAGTACAVLAWGSRLLAGLVTPVAVALAAVPTLAFVPLIAQVLGYDTRTVVAVAAVVAFFPAFVYGSSGLRTPPPGAAAVLTTLGARRLTVLRRLALPAAAAHLLVALRISASTAVVAAVVAEYLLGTDGLGQAFVHHYRRFDTDRAFGIAVVVMAVSFATYGLAARLERRGVDRLT
jgi:putative hydroxymethylpyrimidine transport system permease protein